MLTYRLVHLIETHADTLAGSLLRKVQRSEFTRAYELVPADELKRRVREIYVHFGEWIISMSDSEVGRHYDEIGIRRAEQRVPLSQLIWAIILTKETLCEFILSETTPDRAVELASQQELWQLIDHFFDRAIHAAALGHEWASEQIRSATHSGRHAC